MPRNNPTTQLASFNGLLTASEAYEIGFRGQTIAENVDLSRAQKIRRRPGTTRVYEGNVDSAWFDNGETLFIDNGALKTLDSAFAASTLRSDLTGEKPLVAYRLGGKIYYSNGEQTGIYENGVDRTFGLDQPSGFTASVGSGALDAGTYLYTVTFLRDDAQESGASNPGVIDLPNGGALVLSSLPVSSDSTVTAKNIYISRPNGTELFYAVTVPNADSTATFGGRPNQLNLPIRSLFLQKPPPFTAIDWYNGRLLFASGEFLFWTNPFAYELYDIRYNFIPFDEEVVTLGVTDNGVYVGTTSAQFYLGGNDMSEVQMTQKAAYGSVAGRTAYAEATQLNSEVGQQRAPLWVTKTGIVLGLNGGQLVNLTEKRADFTDDPKKAAMYMRQRNGQNHFVSVVQT